MEDTTDMQFLQGLFKKFVPAKVSYDGGRRLKRPIFTGWLNVTAEESIELVRAHIHQCVCYCYINIGYAWYAKCMWCTPYKILPALFSLRTVYIGHLMHTTQQHTNVH